VILTFGGTALFLLAQIVFLYEAFGDVPRSRPLALAALAILALATWPLTLIAGIAAATAVLIGVAVADTMDTAPNPASPRTGRAAAERR
jgi:hypothetical protein